MGYLILGGEVIIPVEASAFCGGEALDGEVQPFICIFLVDNWQAPLSGSTARAQIVLRAAAEEQQR